MITDDDFKALTERVAKIEAFMGDMDIRHAADVAGKYHDGKELPNGDYPLAQNMHQLREAVNQYAARLGGTTAPSTPAPSTTPTPLAPTPNPAPSTVGTIPGLSVASRAEVVAALKRSTGGVQWRIDEVNRIETELAKGNYLICDPAAVLTVNDIYFGPANTADRDIIERYRRIIDQRIPGTDDLYPVGDPRIKQVSGSASTSPAPKPAPSNPTTPSPAGTQIVHGDFVVHGRLIVQDDAAYAKLKGVPQTGAAVQLYGVGADIFFASDIAGDSDEGVTDGPHGARIGVAPEGGLRMGHNEPYNNPYHKPEVRWGYVGFDSLSEWSMYQQAPGVPHESAQDVVFHFDEPAKEIRVECHRPGWKIVGITSTGLRTKDQRKVLAP